MAGVVGVIVAVAGGVNAGVDFAAVTDAIRKFCSCNRVGSLNFAGNRVSDNYHMVARLFSPSFSSQCFMFLARSSWLRVVSLLTRHAAQ